MRLFHHQLYLALYSRNLSCFRSSPLTCYSGVNNMLQEFFTTCTEESFVFVSLFKTICLIFTRPRDGDLVFKTTSAMLNLSGTLWPNTQMFYCPSDHWGSSMCLLSPYCKPFMLQNQCKRPQIQLICVVSAPLPPCCPFSLVVIMPRSQVL